MVGQKNTKGFQYCIWMKIMIASFNFLTTVAAPGKGTDAYVCFSINGDAYHPIGFISNLVRSMDIRKDIVCLSYFFLGLHFVTFLRQKPI